MTEPTGTAPAAPAPSSPATPDTPRNRHAVDLFLVSVLLLFLELTVIRWIPATIRIVAYYSNLVLVSCFLGFGLGCILRRRHDLFRYFPLLVLLVLVACQQLGAAGVANPQHGDEYVFGGGGRYQWLVALPLIFIVNALPFVAIGQRMARHLDCFRPIPGYTVNIAGSLVGTVAFAALSFFELAPLWWFAASFAIAARLLWSSPGGEPGRRPLARKAWLAAALVLFAVALGLVGRHQRGVLWSPYYRIEVEPLPPAAAGGHRIIVNSDYHQLALDLSDRWLLEVPALRAWRLTYDLPYLALAERPPQTVLVLGAGAGNDVAAALRNRAERVDAVELDPTIHRLGVELHPEHPYSDPRVRLFLDDARYFLRRGGERYDLVVLGWLDSHRLFSSFSNVRQDTFVYTLESMRSMRERLTAQGVLCLSFYTGQPWIGQRIFSMLRSTFGHDPEVFALASGGYAEQGLIFVISSDPAASLPRQVEGFTNLTAGYQDVDRPPPPASDDWPYLYYRDRTLSWEYLSMAALVMAVAAAMVGPVILGGGFGLAEGLHFFLLGAGFLLLEVRNITLLALAFGSTWLTTSIVIAAVLLMILIANVLVEKRVMARHGRLAWGLLLGSVVLSLAWREELVPLASPLARGLLTTGVVSLTFLFAGIVFARSFAQVERPSAALGFNVLGAVFGGMTEYLSLVVGISGLSWTALGLYALALLSASRWRRSQVDAALPA